VIDLFSPPKIEHKNAVKVKGYISIRDDEEFNLKRFLKRKQREETQKKAIEKRKLEGIARLRQDMIEAQNAYNKAFKIYSAARTEMCRLRAAKDRRERAYRRAHVD